MRFYLVEAASAISRDAHTRRRGIASIFCWGVLSFTSALEYESFCSRLDDVKKKKKRIIFNARLARLQGIFVCEHCECLRRQDLWLGNDRSKYLHTMYIVQWQQTTRCIAKIPCHIRIEAAEGVKEYGSFHAVAITVMHSSVIAASAVLVNFFLSANFVNFIGDSETLLPNSFSPWVIQLALSRHFMTRDTIRNMHDACVKVFFAIRKSYVQLAPILGVVCVLRNVRFSLIEYSFAYGKRFAHFLPSSSHTHSRWLQASPSALFNALTCNAQLLQFDEAT